MDGCKLYNQMLCRKSLVRSPGRKLGDFEEVCIDCRALVSFITGAGRTSIIDDALEFLDVGQTPVVKAGCRRIFGVCQCFFPVHAAAAVHLLPHQAGNMVRYLIVAIVGAVELIAGILGILTVNSFIWFRTADFISVVIIAYDLARIDNGIT